MMYDLDIRKLHNYVIELHDLNERIKKMPLREARGHHFRRDWLIGLIADLFKEKTVANKNRKR